MAANSSLERWVRAAQVTAVVSIVSIAVGVALSLLYFVPDPVQIYVSPAATTYAIAQTILAAIVYAVLGWLIGTRRPGHVIGALYLLVGFLFGVFFLVGGVQFFLESQPERDQTLAPYLAWVGELLYNPPLFIPFTLVLQFFPDGRLPSPRWRFLPALTVASLLLTTGSLALAPWPFAGTRVDYNPFAITGFEAALTFAWTLGVLLALLALFGSLLAVAVRFRRSRGRERRQIKWLAYTAAVGILLLLISTLFRVEIVQLVVYSSLPTALALAVGVAILRHGLFDIDVIIRRTLQYTLVSALLALVYFGVVALLTSLLTRPGGQGSELVTVLATLAVAALFAPLRRRVQEFIDRRFYRQKYDAALLLADFAASARNEADLERITAELIRVTSMAMQAEHVSLWLNEPEGT